MLDIKKIRSNPELFRTSLSRKRELLQSTIFDEVIELDERRRLLVGELNAFQTELNAISKTISQKPSSDLKLTAKELSEKVKQHKNHVTTVENLLDSALSKLPNTPLPDVPSGKGAEDNVRISFWKVKPTFDFDIKDHLTLAKDLDILDFERGAKVAGSGFPVWKGVGAKLERALITYMLDLHTANNYVEILPPLVINRQSAYGTGQLPKSEADMYYVAQDSLFLIPTAEVPVTNLHRDEILQHTDLPIHYVAYSPCFRREAGGHGKKTKGFLRVHQFNKVELVKITKGDLKESTLAHEAIRNDAEQILRNLGLHYRVMELCDADLSFAAAKCYDIEVWSPAENQYLEASSCSNFLDFQARRMNLRYRDENGKVQYCHTLNGSGLATSRLLVALLETYQLPNGHIQVPEVLRPYIGVDII